MSRKLWPLALALLAMAFLAACDNEPKGTYTTPKPGEQKAGGPQQGSTEP